MIVLEVEEKSLSVIFQPQ